MCLHGNMQQADLGQFKFTVAEFGTVVRFGNGDVQGVYPTDDEAYEMMLELLESEMEES